VSILWTLSMPKRDGRRFTGVSTIFEREPHSDPHFNERAFLNINDINDISYLERPTAIIVVL
jgi:hypothetical protein